MSGSLNQIKNCDILFEGETISNSMIVETYSNYLIEILDNPGKNSGYIYHTGSSIFDIILPIYIAIACVIYDELTPQEFVASLRHGDIIIYNDKTRAKFLGMDDNGFARIQYGESHGKYSPITETISPASFYKIKLYQGEATILDGRGLRSDSQLKLDFLQKVFKIDRSDISGVHNKSAVIVCNRSFADSFIEGVQIRYGGTKCAKITDLIPVSYLSDNNQYYYHGNPGRNTPVLKFTSKVSVARELVFMDEEKIISTVAVLGGQALKSGESELPDFINRRGLKNFFTSIPFTEYHHGYNCALRPNASIFACTKDMLLSFSLPSEPCGPLTAEIELQISNILDREINEHIVDSILEPYEYAKLRKNILSIKNYSRNDETINRFIIESYSLINYFSSIPFALNDVESVRAGISHPYPSTEEKISFLESVVRSYGGKLADFLLSVFNSLHAMSEAVKTNNPKNRALLDLLECALQSGTVLILVPKPFYIDIFKALLPINLSSHGDLYMKTTGAFDCRGSYGTIITIGCLGTKQFSIFSTFVAPINECLLYPHEQYLFNHQKDIFAKKELELNSCSKLKYEVSDEVNVPTCDADISESQEIDYYVEQITLRSMLQIVSVVDEGASTKADIVRIATTTDGETIFFTKYFTPYIFDRDQMTVVESGVFDIVVGDMLLFTKNSDQAKDIVEEIIKKIASSNEKIADDFRKSLHWKEKLLGYKEKNGLSFYDLSNKMREYGTQKHPATLRTWLNPESRIIAPREQDAFDQIALICEDDEMLSSPESFCEACNAIRSLRIRILKLIGQSVIKNYQQETNDIPFLSTVVSEQLDALSQIVQVNSIMDVSDVQVSVTYANRPYVL